MSLVFWRRAWTFSRWALSTSRTGGWTTWTDETPSTSAGSCLPWWVGMDSELQKNKNSTSSLLKSVSGIIIFFCTFDFARQQQRDSCLLKTGCGLNWVTVFCTHCTDKHTPPAVFCIIKCCMQEHCNYGGRLKVVIKTSVWLLDLCSLGAHIYLLCSDKQRGRPGSAERELVRWLQTRSSSLLVDWERWHPETVDPVWFQPGQVRTVLGVCSGHVHRWLYHDDRKMNYILVFRFLPHYASCVHMKTFEFQILPHISCIEIFGHIGKKDTYLGKCPLFSFSHVNNQ